MGERSALILEDRYLEFLKGRKSNSYNLAYAWIRRQDEFSLMNEENLRSTAEILANF